MSNWHAGVRLFYAQADVVVVGSGGAALIAAVHAAMRGAKVVVLEKAPIFGGTTAISGGGQWLPGNPLGPEMFGLQDTRAEVESYLAGVTGGTADPARLSAFLDAAPQYVDFFLKHFPGEVEAADIPDYNMLHAGAKGPEPGPIFRVGSIFRLATTFARFGQRYVTNRRLRIVISGVSSERRQSGSWTT